MTLILCLDPWLACEEHIYEDTKLRISCGRNVPQKLERHNPHPTCIFSSRGRNRPLFRPIQTDHPECSDLFGMVNPLPPPFKPTDAFPMFKDFVNCFHQADWRTEEGTKRGFEKMEEAMEGLLRQYHVELVVRPPPTSIPAEPPLDEDVPPASWSS
ncbi:hypothetical protein BDN72DRAFT_841860 [Pluteus cervinus]|uniref:Uncharacterized protein n=1 Tax=Pluteus cervinus TaxID=181527 RepID=A0ACD3AR33_9AGAR|nr:hypothetical protein BDN72DRAFT_841860 [Pluteus cervinus]